MWVITATWCMALDGVRKAAEMLKGGADGADALETLITDVESNPGFTSVGYGGLPDRDGNVMLDAGFMDGTTLNTGAVMSISGFASPFRIARSLSGSELNNVLAGGGAEAYAAEHDFEQKDMCTELSISRWKQAVQQTHLAYRGHDTVGALVLDEAGNIYAGTSTSGLFMKLPGRVGDSPLAGSGFYADSLVGAAAATGLGEDLMKGCISYETVRLMKEGHTAQEACELAVKSLDSRLKKARGSAGDLSVIAVSKNGDCGAFSNISEFSFVTASDTKDPCVYVVKENGNIPADTEWIRAYMERHHQF
ncbi:MAG: isoaspartyl peptidase/L-asparaginase [Erysipelotrichaceae bacterium]|nr:isoaspartyl peptidase/L-asparaginase [Erysipelotrichaceae bacterium]